MSPVAVKSDKYKAICIGSDCGKNAQCILVKVAKKKTKEPSTPVEKSKKILEKDLLTTALVKSLSKSSESRPEGSYNVRKVLPARPTVPARLRQPITLVRPNRVLPARPVVAIRPPPPNRRPPNVPAPARPPPRQRPFSTRRQLINLPNPPRQYQEVITPERIEKRPTPIRQYQSEVSFKKEESKLNRIQEETQEIKNNIEEAKRELETIRDSSISKRSNTKRNAAIKKVNDLKEDLIDNINRESDLENKIGNLVSNSIEDIKAQVEDIVDDKIDQLDQEKENIQTGEGRQDSDSDSDSSDSDDDHGLYDYEIEEQLEDMPSFKGVISQDEIDTLKPSKLMAFVQNTDNHDQPGTHWTCTWLDAKNKYQVCYFDPLGNPPSDTYLKDIKTLIDKIKPEYMLKLKINTVPNQADDTSTCGWQTINFLNKMNNGESFAEATGYKEYTGNNIKEGEKESNKLKKQAGFGFI